MTSTVHPMAKITPHPQIDPVSGRDQLEWVVGINRNNRSRSSECASFNARFRDELLNAEVFYTLKEAQVIIEKWRKHYNTKRPHSALG